MLELRHNTEVQLMKQSDTLVTSDFLNHSRSVSFVVLQNIMKCIARLNSCVCFFLGGSGEVEPNCAQ